MFEPMQSALAFNIIIAIVLTMLYVPHTTHGTLIEDKKQFGGQERGKSII